MKSSEFYQRAATDPTFRRAELDNLRYYKKVGTGLMWFCGVVGVAFWLCGGLAGRGWTSGMGLITLVPFTALIQGSCATRIRVLESFDAKRAPGETAVPIPKNGNANLD